MPLFIFSVRKICCLSAIILLLMVTTTASAQLKADFTADVYSGCPTLPVNFTNTSTGTSPAATYTWNFANGNGITTNVKNGPIGATYFAGGVYVVTLVIHDGAKTDSASKTITVYKKPTINFTASRTVGCSPLSVDFSSSLVAGSGIISGAVWNFGDGNSQNTTAGTVTNNYQFPGTYSVSLTVTNSFGCVNTLTNPNMVTVYPALVPSFNVDSAAICSLNQPVIFHNTSTGAGSLAYTWNFGGGPGDTSNLTNPSHLFPAKGNYTISLTVSNTYGCSSSITKNAFINAANFSADFTTANSYCQGNVILFINKSTPAPSGTPIWSFGDGGSGIGFTYGHNYATAGVFTVKMFENFGSCPDSVVKNITILSAPNISPFIINKGASCSSPMTVQFTDTSLGATNWHWNFTSNPGDTSDIRTPSFTYTSNNLFSPTLTITNANGCSSTVSETINTAQPTATIHKDTILVPSATYCADVQATFTAISADTLATYLWTFGDGTTSTLANPVHTFTKPGTYIINLSFTTIHGCAGGAFPSDTVIVYPKPHASFDAYDSLPCTTNQLETFINLDDSAAKFQWFYGDGTSDINNNDVHTHLYADSGLYTMTLVASSPGCAPDDTTITRYVKTTPMPNLTVVNNCDSNRLSAKLTVAPPGGSQYVWDFGDGSPLETDFAYIPTKNHHYPKGGRYLAEVKVLFGSCWQTTGQVPVYVLDNQKPVLSSTKDTICQSSPLPVKITSLDTNYHSKATGIGTYYRVVKWQYDDGTTFNANNGFKVTYSGNINGLLQGKDSIRAILQSDFFGCNDTTNYIPIHMIGPIAKFGDSDQLCYHAPVIFSDSSTPGANSAPIISWKWDFGDGNGITKATNDTVGHTYAFPGTYNPKLTVTDTNGCFNSYNQSVTQVLIYGAKANLTWKPPTITPGFPITFYNKTIKNTGVTYLWRFSGDGATSTSPDSVVHIFPNVGSDTVTLIAYPSMAGTCIDTLVVPLKIQSISAPFIDSSYYFFGSACPPMGVNFTSFPVNTTSLEWDFGDSSTHSFLQNPAHQYDTPGVYIVSLTGYGANGISVISYDTITVKGPYAKLYSPLYQACAPAPDTLRATASYVGSYTWDFGDGSLTTTTDTFALHTYTLPGMFTPAVILTDSTGCQLSYKSDHQILIDTIHASLRTPTLLCGIGSISYGPYVVSYANDTLPLLYPLTYHWDFGTGNPADTSNIKFPTFGYSTPGDFITTFQVSSPVGCTATVYDSVHVIGPFPMPVSPDTTICIGGMAYLSASNANNYLWAPGNTLNKTTGDSVIAKPAFTTVYSVIGEDKYKCYMDTANIRVTVDSLPSVTIPQPNPVLAGTDVTIDPIYSADVVSYDWTPPLYLNCTDCATPISTPLAPITYSVTVKTADGCTSTTSVKVRLLCLQTGVYMANAFSPNSDGNNDYFYPTGSGVKVVKSFQVYSRWGQLLYSRANFPPNDFKYGWDGNLNGIPQPLDTYVYVAEMICFTGENFILKGTVELLR